MYPFQQRVWSFGFFAHMHGETFIQEAADPLKVGFEQYSTTRLVVFNKGNANKKWP